MMEKEMQILMLVNWKVEYCELPPIGKQPPDYKADNEDYWFFRYFKNKPNVDVVDVSSCSWLERFEKNKLHFYVWQSIKAIPQLNKYDLVISHGMQSAVVICLWRRLFKTNAKHIVFDIGCFASASESGFPLRLMQFASKSLDGLIYHMGSQKKYYEKFFPWVVSKSIFIKYGVDNNYFSREDKANNTAKPYIVCVGRNKCDWDTLVTAYKLCNLELELHLVGAVEKKFDNLPGVVQIPYLPIEEYISQVQRAELCVLPLEEVKFSFGQMRLLQQMAMQKCVIVSQVPSIVDYVINNENAVFYKAGDAMDLKEKITTFHKNEKERSRLALNASRYVKNNCNEKMMAIEIEKYFYNLMEI